MKPPVTNYSIDNFPQSHWLLVVDGAIIEALQSKGILKLRNEMNYQDQGGTTVRLEGKGQKYFQFASSMYQRWMQALADFKEGISVESAWGGVNSEYQRNFW